MIALLGLVDAGFSGDWQARGYLSDAAAATARTACFTAAAAHVALTAAAGFIAQAKGEGLAAAAITLAVRKMKIRESATLWQCAAVSQSRSCTGRCGEHSEQWLLR